MTDFIMKNCPATSVPDVVQNRATLFRVAIGWVIGKPSKIHIARVTQKRYFLNHAHSLGHGYF